MNAPIKLIRKTVSRQLGGFEWRWPSGRLAVWSFLDNAAQEKSSWCAAQEENGGWYRGWNGVKHPNPESAARSVGATTEGS